MLEPSISRVSIEVYQEGNTLGTTQEIEEMEIILESPLGNIDKDGAFLVIKTNGWSMQNEKDFAELIDKIKSFNIGEAISE